MIDTKFFYCPASIIFLITSTHKRKKQTMRLKRLFVFFIMIFVLKGHAQSSKVVYDDTAFISAILQAHAGYRSSLQEPALTWSVSLAKDTKVWAQHLASINKMDHDMSVRGREGENLFVSTANSFSYPEMVGMWGNEQKSFKYGVFPDCTTSRSAVVGHYTQMVWKNTQSVGCALASNGQSDFLVCRYLPAGNIVGEKPY
jgi:hypothetical protein